jgi:hypothetical protein
MFKVSRFAQKIALSNARLLTDIEPTFRKIQSKENKADALDKSKKESNVRFQEPDLFSGRGTPALMSEKEPAIRLLKERYHESFAITRGAREGQVHLFLIKLGMWALVWTFTMKDANRSSREQKSGKFGIQDALKIIESAVNGKNVDFLQKLDLAISKALERIRSRIEEIKKTT